MTYEPDAKPEDPFFGHTHPSIGQDGWRDWFKPSFIYVIASGRDERPVKIGYAGDIKQRILAFEAGNPYGLRALHQFPTFKGIARQVERRVHDQLKHLAMGREWFNIHADEAAVLIPPACARGTAALGAYRDAMLADDAAMAAAEAEAERKRRMTVIVHRAHAQVGLQRALRRS